MGRCGSHAKSAISATTLLDYFIFKKFDWSRFFHLYVLFSAFIFLFLLNVMIWSSHHFLLTRIQCCSIMTYSNVMVRFIHVRTRVYVATIPTTTNSPRVLTLGYQCCSTRDWCWVTISRTRTRSRTVWTRDSAVKFPRPANIWLHFQLVVTKHSPRSLYFLYNSTR